MAVELEKLYVQLIPEYNIRLCTQSCFETRHWVVCSSMTENIRQIMWQSCRHILRMSAAQSVQHRHYTAIRIH